MLPSIKTCNVEIICQMMNYKFVVNNEMPALSIKNVDLELLKYITCARVLVPIHDFKGENNVKY